MYDNYFCIPAENWSTKRNTMLLSLGSTLFHFKIDPFSEGDWGQYLFSCFISTLPFNYFNLKLLLSRTK